MRSSTDALQASTNAREQSLLRGLTGRVAIANAKLAYQRYQELFGGRRWQALAARGARTQRLLWASTGAKNPSYRDVVYVEELIGPDTVNTIPPATFEAFRDHGRPRASLTEDSTPPATRWTTLAQVGISMNDVTDRLLAEGVRLFADAFDEALEGRGEAEQGSGSGKDQSPDLHTPRAAGRCGERFADGMARAGQGATALGPGCAAVDRQGRGALARLARRHERPAGPHRAIDRTSPRWSGARASPMRSCSGWADRASGLKS